MAQPTVRQIYALAAALCERMGEEFPETREAASETIERLRIENGHPQPRLEDVPLRPRRPRRHGRGADRLAGIIAKRLAEELSSDSSARSKAVGRSLQTAAPQAEPQ